MIDNEATSKAGAMAHRLRLMSTGEWWARTGPADQETVMIKDKIRRMEAIVNLLGAALRCQNTPHRRLQTPQDVIDLLEEQVASIRADKAAGAVEKARAIGYLANIARRAIEMEKLVARLERLEEMQKRR
jgi:hypothetical protein